MAGHRTASPGRDASGRLAVILALACMTWLTSVTCVLCADLVQSEEQVRGGVSLDSFFAAVTNKTEEATLVPTSETTTPLLVFPDPSETLVQLATLQSGQSGDRAAVSSGQQSWSFSQEGGVTSSNNGELASGQSGDLTFDNHVLTSNEQNDLILSHEDLISVPESSSTPSSQDNDISFTKVDVPFSKQDDSSNPNEEGDLTPGQLSEVIYSDEGSASLPQVGIDSQIEARVVTSSQVGSISSNQLSPSVSGDCVVLVNQVDGVLRPTEGTPCLFRLQRRPDHCAVRLQLTRPGSLSCLSARLDMDGQPLCDQLSGAVEIVRNFTGDAMTLDVELGMDTEPRHGGLGLVVASALGAEGAEVEPAATALPEVRFRQEPCDGASVALTEPQLLGEPDIPPTGICFQEFSEPAFRFRSPGFPGSYPPDTICQYEIRRSASDVCRLELTLNAFDVEGVATSVCPFDYLQAGDQRLCGLRPPGEVIYVDFVEPVVEFQFHSDEQTQRSGFEITTRQLSCVDPPTPGPAPRGDCDAVFTEQEFTMESPDFPAAYPVSTSCRYEILRASPTVCELQLTVEAFALESAADCALDFFEIGGERLCGVLPTGETRLVPFGAAPTLLAEFQSDERGSGPGFRLRAKQIDCDPNPGPGPSPGPSCDLVISDPVFELTSPGFPLDYPADSNCRYQVRRALPDICSLEVTVRTFDLENSLGCVADRLELEGERLCGIQPVGFTRNLTFTGEQLTLAFISDVVNQRQGFDLLLRQVRCSSPGPSPDPGPFPPIPPTQPPPSFCGGALFGRQVEISSPGFPGPYPGGVSCVYSLQKANEAVCELEVRFDVFELDLGPFGAKGCRGDFIEVGEERICRAQPGEARRFPFRNAAAELLFHSDAVGPGGRFLLQLRQVDCGAPAPPVPPPGGACRAELRADGALVRFTSPNFPAPPPTTHCSLVIKRALASSCTLEMRVRHFELAPEEPVCSVQYLQIGKLQERVCGTHPAGYGRRFSFEGDFTTVEFVSELVGTVSGGFDVEFEQLPCAQPYPDHSDYGEHAGYEHHGEHQGDHHQGHHESHGEYHESHGQGHGQSHHSGHSQHHSQHQGHHEQHGGYRHSGGHGHTQVTIGSTYQPKGKWDLLQFFKPWTLFSKKPKRFIAGPGPVYGPPPVTVHGPPKAHYGPPKPRPSYGPPKPKPAYGPPRPQPRPAYGPPRPGSHYGPPKPKPKPSYGPPIPGSHYGLPKPKPNPSYGPPRPGSHYGLPKPKPSYGPPRPGSHYGPARPGSHYGAPSSGHVHHRSEQTDDNSPEVVPKLAFDGWIPI